MEVSELEKLAEWYVGHFDQLNSLYQKLISPIQNNATQPTKQPIEQELDSLINFMRAMDFEVLSIQQIKALDKVGVSQFIGVDGADFIDQTIRTANYDPATAVARLNEAFSQISQARNHFDTALQSLNGLGLRTPDTECAEFILIRVGFQGDASITNMAEWKDYAKEWYDIIRGVAIAVEEAPENTRVVGATTGSIILNLTGTYAVTGLLARISKHITGVAKEILELLHSWEDLKQKRIGTETMKLEFDRLIEERQTSAVQAIMDDVKPLIKNEDGEKLTALAKSVEKLLDFNQKGGNVDFVAPESDGSVDDDDHTDGEAENQEANKAAREAVREIIREYQEVREQLKLLMHHSSSSQ